MLRKTTIGAASEFQLRMGLTPPVSQPDITLKFYDDPSCNPFGELLIFTLASNLPTVRLA